MMTLLSSTYYGLVLFAPAARSACPTGCSSSGTPAKACPSHLLDSLSMPGKIGQIFMSYTTTEETTSAQDAERIAKAAWLAKQDRPAWGMTTTRKVGATLAAEETGFTRKDGTEEQAAAKWAGFKRRRRELSLRRVAAREGILGYKL